LVANVEKYPGELLSEREEERLRSSGNFVVGDEADFNLLSVNTFVSVIGCSLLDEYLATDKRK
jgi:hypothetical protein